MTTEAEWIKFLEIDHKISESVWRDSGLSFDENHLYISYFSPSGEFLYKKTRENPSYKGKDKYLYPPGAVITPYLYHKIRDQGSIILTEGELDTLTLTTVGFSATTAGGTTAFKKEFISYFKGKKVCICFDNDEPGKEAAQKVAVLLANADIDASVIDLPQMKDGKDIGDFFRIGHTKNDFIELSKKARKVEARENTQASGTETPVGVIKQKLIEQSLTYIEVEEKVKNLLPNSQAGLKLILAVAASSSFPNPTMLWLLMVGVPSSGKTDLVRLIKEADTTFYLDNLTQNAFISGERASKSNKVHDLLPLLNKKCLVIKDWTSIFSLDEKMTKKLLGELVGIYDKEFTKFSSTRGSIGYISAFSQLGCITPATLNKHTNYMNMVGPRFLCYTMPSSTPEDENRSYDLIFSNKDRSLIEKEARLYVSSYLAQLVQKTPDIKPLSRGVKQYLRTAAELMSNCRGIVILQSASFKNEDGEEVKYYEVLDVQIEQPWRAVQQLITLAKYLAFIVGKDDVGVDELVIVKDIVISSMPADRSQALRTLKKHEGEITAKEMADISEKSTKTSRRLLDELSALKAVEKIKGSGTIASDYRVTDQFKDFLLLTPTEFMSRKENRGTETLYGEEAIEIVSTGFIESLIKEANDKT